MVWPDAELDKCTRRERWTAEVRRFLSDNGPQYFAAIMLALLVYGFIVELVVLGREP